MNSGAACLYSHRQPAGFFPSLQRVERKPSGSFATASKCELASARADESSSITTRSRESVAFGAAPIWFF